MKIYDVTVALTPDIPVYPGDPAFQIQPVSSLAAGDICTVSQLSFSSHTGTHVDPPAHFVPGGMTLDQLPLDVLVGKARVIATTANSITARFVERLDLSGVERVLFKTHSSAQWQKAEATFDPNFVYLETDAALHLVSQGIKLVGIDSLSVEKFNFDVPATHYALLRNNVIIIEGLNLSAVAEGDYELICLPLKVKGGDGAPARVILRELGATANAPLS